MARTKGYGRHATIRFIDQSQVEDEAGIKSGLPRPRHEENCFIELLPGQTNGKSQASGLRREQSRLAGIDA